MSSLPVVADYKLAESVERTQARREIKQARKWPEFREDDAAMVVRAAREGIPPSKQGDIPGFPSTREIGVWRQVNPDFDADLRAALEDRADELAAQVLETAMDQDREPACRKVEIDACKWIAGVLSDRYRAKPGAGEMNNIQVNVAGDVNVSPADAYLSMIGG